MPQITTLAQLQEQIGKDFTEDIILHSKLGDPDWLFDMVGELDYLSSSSPFFLPEFHGKLQDYCSGDIDAQAINWEIRTLTLTPEQQIKFNNLKSKL